MIRAERLGRRFGDRRVLQGVDLALGPDEFLVVAGPNGAGKTTLLRLLAGLLAPTEGTLETTVDRGRVGFLAHEPLLYRDLTALENLELFGRLYRIRERRERAGMLLERFGLWDVRREPAATFSRGMLQRLAICRTLFHDPDLLLLDEPFSGLDVDGAELLDAELATREQRAVVVATHQPERVAAHATARLALA